MTAPAITGQPQDVTATVGRTAAFTVTVDGVPSPSFQWQVNKGSGWSDVTDGTGGDTTGYTTPAVTKGMDGWQYHCVITNIAGTVTTDAAILTVEKEKVSDTAVMGITPPAAGAVPDTNADLDSNAGYTAEKVSWKNANEIVSGNFGYGTAYTVCVTLLAKQDYQFADIVTGTINGQTVSVSRTNGTEVILSYTFDKTESLSWAVNVENGTGDGSYVKDAVVNITADNAPSGKVFETWTTDSMDVIFDNPNSVNTSFIMPEHPVTVTANFKTLPPATYAVTVRNGTSDKTAASEGETVTITAGTAPAGQTFDKWTTADSVTFANKNAASTTFTMPPTAVMVTAAYKNSGGVSSAGGGDGSSYTEPEPQSSYTLTGDNIGQSVSRYDLKKLADSGTSLTLRCDKASMTFGPAALKAILAAVLSTAGNITFAAAPADMSAFPDAAKLIGAHPVYNFTISYKDSKGNLVAVPVNFPAGSAAITLTYAPVAAEITGNLFMVYVDGKGAVTWLDKSSYDSGKMLAEIPHFSTYGVACKAPALVFTDITGHPAKEDIEFVAARGLLSGTGNGLFSPDSTMTRGMFVTALGRLAGVNPDSYQTRSFTDVKADAYYAAYVEWAAQKNIVKGTGDKLFSPDAPVTREQMAVMMVNYAGQMGYSIPTPLTAVVFADGNKISEWAAKEVAAMQRAGIIKGKDGNRFDPQGNATRAEVSAVLRRLVEVVIDPATATGWVKNDSGHWLYYKGKTALTAWQTIGKLRYYFNADGVMHEGWKQDTDTNKWYYWTNAGAVTGWREIGGKWYYFDENGVMAVNTKVNGYEVGPDGARQ